MAENNPFELAEKLFLYRIGKLNQSQRKALEQQMVADPRLKALAEELYDLEQVHQELQQITAFDTNKAYAEAFETVYPKKRLSRIHYGLIAASIVLIITVGILFRFLSSTQVEPEVLIAQQDSVDGVQLMLATGERIRTDTISFIRANETEFSEKDGALVVQTDQTTSSSTQHKIIVPHKHTYQVVLADGSKVSLNAGSTLTFPASFQGNERWVELEGEAFFQIAHVPNKPFFVGTEQQRIRVLGTTFNVKAYANETIHYTTLVEGSIALQHQDTKNEIFLSPGHQARYDKTTQQTTLQNTDPTIAANWKDGWLAFDSTPMDEILRQIGRWYNLDIILLDQSLHDMAASGKIQLYPDVSDVLRKFEKLGDIRFETVGHQVFVQHIKPNLNNQ